MDTSGTKSRIWHRFSNTEIFAIVISAIALIVSAYSAIVDLDTHRDELGANTISDVYAEYRSGFDVLAEWPEVSHLYEVLDYPGIKDEVMLAASEATSAERAQLRLRERAVAFSIFVSFERVLFLHIQASAVGDTERAAFLHKNLDYYTERLLTNPRLRWLWSPLGGAVYQQMETESIDYYNRTVNQGSTDAPPEEMDESGPFVGRTEG